MAQQLDISRDCRAAQRLSTSLHRSARTAQRLRTEHEMLQQSSAAAGGRHRPTLRLACLRAPALYPRLLYSLRAWSGRIPRAFCILSLLLLLLFHIVATDGCCWLTTTTKSSSSRKHSAFMRSLQLGDILIQSTPSGPLDL